MDGNSDLLILGHSFVRRLQEYVFRRNDTNKVVGADLGISEQFSNVFYRGIGGLTLDGLMHELPLVRDLAVRGVILDIGTNDLSASHVDPVNLAKRIVDFAKLVACGRLPCLMLINFNVCNHLALCMFAALPPFIFCPVVSQ